MTSAVGKERKRGCEARHHEAAMGGAVWRVRLGQLGVFMLSPDGISMNAFYVHKWGNFGCEVCGARVWTWCSSETYPYMGIPAILPQDALASAFWGVMGLSCNNCGNLKLVNLQVVWNWLNSEEGKRLADVFRASQAPIGGAT